MANRRPGSNEPPARLEVRLGVALQALECALGLRISRLAEQPVDAQLATERGERFRRPAAVAVDAGLPIPDQRLGQRAEPLHAAGDAGEQVLGLLAEHQHARARARVAKTRDHHPRAAGLAVTDGHLLTWLPEIELADLAGSIDGALKRPRRRREQRADLAQIVIDDRLADGAAQRLQQLPNPDAGQLRIALQQPWISGLNGSSTLAFGARR